MNEHERPEDFVTMDEASERQLKMNYYRIGEDVTGTISIIRKQKATFTVHMVIAGTEVLTYKAESN